MESMEFTPLRVHGVKVGDPERENWLVAAAFRRDCTVDAINCAHLLESLRDSYGRAAADIVPGDIHDFLIVPPGIEDVERLATIEISKIAGYGFLDERRFREEIDNEILATWSRHDMATRIWLADYAGVPLAEVLKPAPCDEIRDLMRAQMIEDE